MTMVRSAFFFFPPSNSPVMIVVSSEPEHRVDTLNKVPLAGEVASDRCRCCGWRRATDVQQSEWEGNQNAISWPGLDWTGLGYR